MLQRSPRRVRMLAVPAVLLLALAACGDDDDDTGGDDTEVAIDATEPTAGESTTPDGTASSGTASSGTASSGTASSGTAGSGETYEVDEYVDALVTEIGGDEEGSECVARAVVDAIGTDRLEASGVTPDDLAGTSSLEDLDLGVDPASGPALQADLEACPDLIALFGEADDASEEEIQCVRDNLSQAQIAEFFVAQFTGGELSQELLDAQQATQACSGN